MFNNIIAHYRNAFNYIQRGDKMFKKTVAIFLALLMSFSIGMAVLAAPPTDNPGSIVFRNGSPSGLVFTSDGRWLIADSYNRVIWSMYEGDAPTIFAGRNKVRDADGRPVAGYLDTISTSAAFHSPWAIAPFLNGFLVSDTGNNVIRYVTKSSVQTAIGSSEGMANGNGLQALLRQPTGLAVDSAGNAYIADTGNNVIRKLDTAGNVTTFAGIPWYNDPDVYEQNFATLYKEGYRDGTVLMAKFNQPTGLCWHNGALYVADSGNHKIRKIENGVVTTVAGVTFPADATQAANLGFSVDAAFTGGYRDGTAATSEFSNPQGVVVATDGTIYVADTGNSAIRVIKNNSVSTLIKPDLNQGDLYPVSPRGLALKNDVLYITDTQAGIIFIPLSSVGYTYDDVQRDAWYMNAVATVTRTGIMNGTGNNKFSPLALMDRAMAIRSLANFHIALVDRAANITGNMAYSDIPATAYYTTAANWAAQNNIKVRSADRLFRPHTPISREEFVSLLYQYAASIHLDISAPAGTIATFNDASLVSGDVIAAVEWAVSRGIMGGFENNLNPKGTLRRAEIAQFYTNFCHAYGFIK